MRNSFSFVLSPVKTVGGLPMSLLSPPPAARAPPPLGNPPGGPPGNLPDPPPCPPPPPLPSPPPLPLPPPPRGGCVLWGLMGHGSSKWNGTPPAGILLAHLLGGSGSSSSMA